MIDSNKRPGRTLAGCLAGMSLAFSCGAASAIELAKELADAEKGDCAAMQNAGALYASRRYGEPDYASAMKWFQRAARRGHHDSMYSLGIVYRFGQGVEVDMVQASAWYALAAKHIPKDGDEWTIPRAKVAMYLRTAEEVRKGLTQVQQADAQARAKELDEEIANSTKCT